MRVEFRLEVMLGIRLDKEVYRDSSASLIFYAFIVFYEALKGLQSPELLLTIEVGFFLSEKSTCVYDNAYRFELDTNGSYVVFTRQGIPQFSHM